MKKKLLLTVFLVLVLFCTLAVATLAADVYRTERTYNYYENEISEGNLLFQAKTIYAYDNNNSGKYRFEIITETSGVGFAKFDADGNALTWYVISNDHDISKDFSANEVYTQNIIVKKVKTIGEAGNVDANGAYTYNDGISSKKVVSANFFGTGVKSLPEGAYMALYDSNYTSNSDYTMKAPNGSTTEYSKLADGSYLLALYLPKTLTAIPKRLCTRAPIITLEFEDNTVNYKNLGNAVKVGNENHYPFAFCANLKRLVIPEGITSVRERDFRESISLEYVKFPNTLTSVPNNVFFRAGVPETVILGEKTTFAGYLDSEPYRFYVDTKEAGITTKYYYIPTTIKTTNSKFCAYRGGVTTGVSALSHTNYLIFFVAGTLDEAKSIGQYCDSQYAASYDVSQATSKGLTYYPPITYDEYIQNKEYYDKELTGHLLVFNTPKCIAFYDGNHDLKTGTQYTDTLSPILVGEFCARCDFGESVSYDPIITALGYSAKINGDRVCVGYNINNDSLALVPNLEFGMLVTVPASNTDMSTFEPINNDLTLSVEKGYMHKLEGRFSAFELIVKSFSKNLEYYDFPVVMCAFVTDGQSVDYLSYIDGAIEQTEYAHSTTFREISLNCETAKITYSCNANYGTLSGNAEQFVPFGEESAPVTAIPNEGYEFACWSNGSSDPTITIESKEDMDLVACFTPKSTGLPVMTINTKDSVDILTKEYYIDCEITLLDTETGNSIGGQTAGIKGRGNSTWKYDKKPYKFKFDSKQNLFGYGKEKTWVLLADHRDYSLIRNMLALNVGLSFSELDSTSKGQSVELYVNDEYRGVYYLCEQIQVKENRVNITQEEDGIAPEDVGYLVELDGWAIENASNTPNLTIDGDIYVEVGDNLVGNRRYVIKDPEDVFLDKNGSYNATNAAPYLEYIQAYLEACITAVENDNSTYTYEDVCALVDVKSFAQSYIVQELFKNPDTNYSSVYFYKDKDGKLVAGPLWDFDMALGNQSHKNLHGVSGAFSNPTVLWSASQNPWYKGLLQYDEFKALVASELAENEDTIRATIAENIAYARTHAEAYKKNFNTWDIMGKVVWSNPSYLTSITTWEGHIEYVEKYLNDSLDALLLSYPTQATE